MQRYLFDTMNSHLLVLMKLLFAFLLFTAPPPPAAVMRAAAEGGASSSSSSLKPRSVLVQKGCPQGYHNDGVNNKIHQSPSRHPPTVFLSLRGGGAAVANKKGNIKKKNAVVPQKKKSPFGLPVIFGQSFYMHFDMIPFMVYFALFPQVFLEGTSKKVYAVVGIFHTLHSLVTDYEGKGSWLQRLGIINFAVPQWTMYWADILLSALFLVLPNVVDGHPVDGPVKLFLQIFTLGGLLFFFPFAHCSGGSNK